MCDAIMYAQQQQPASNKRRSVKAVARGAVMRVMSMDGGMTSGNDTETEREVRNKRDTTVVRSDAQNHRSVFCICVFFLPIAGVFPCC